MWRFTYARLISLTLGTVLLFCPGSLFAQELSAGEKQKLGLRLQPIVEALGTAKKAGTSPGPIAAEPFRGGGDATAKAGQEPTYAVFVHTSDPTAVEQTGAQVDSRFSEFVTARATGLQLRALAQLDAVEQVRASGRAQVHNDEAAAFVGARQLNNGFVEGTEYTGEGVLACVIDSGIDYDHPDFVDDDGNSRIVSVWDQTFYTQAQTPNDRHPSLFPESSFEYGTEYHTPEIESGGLSTEDTNGHGTHVAGTVGASGNAHSAGKYEGMAPGVKFIIVRSSAGGSHSVFDTINGLDYCDKVAEEKGMPMIANISIGGHHGPHDGTSVWASSVDEILQNGNASGRAVAISAGNEGQDPIHVSKAISASTSETVDIAVPSYTPQSGSENDEFSAQIWFDRDLDATATVTTPGGVSLTVGPGESVDSTTSDDGGIAIQNSVYTGNGDRRISLSASDPTDSNIPTAGTWTIELQNNSASSVTVNGWLWPFTIGSDSQLITYAGGDTQSTVGIPGTATHAITVGSFMHRWRWYGADGNEHRRPVGNNRSGDLSLFSSEGPRRDGTGEAYKPEISAPGQHVISSLSQDASASASSTIPGGMHVKKQGTSMAAPVVAGSIALLLEEDPSLTSNEIKDLITQTADSDGYTGSTPSTEWGYGRLDVLEAMTQLINSSATASLSIRANGFTPNSSNEVEYQLGNGVSELAVRFQPSQQRRLVGAYFHLSYPSANNLTDSLVVEIRQENGSVPGSRVGDSVTVAPDRLRRGTWNYQSLFETDVQLTAGQNYFLVCYPKNSSDALHLLGENYDASGNTFVFNSGSWSQDSNNDVLVRPVLSSLTGVQALPVELVAFGARTNGQAVSLEWQTASETGNARFEVQQRTEDGSWNTVGTVQGTGTTSEAQSYSYRAQNVSYGTHRFRLRQVDVDGSAHPSQPVKAVVTPSKGLAVQAYPNPVSTTATVKVATGRSQDVIVEMYDLLGRRVAQLHDGTVAPKQPAVLDLEASSYSSGAYFIRVQGKSTTETKRITLVQ